MPPSRSASLSTNASNNTPSSTSGPSSGSAAPDPTPRPPRKLNRTGPQLKRNAACLPCRRRRIKCDAAKPYCSSCLRSYHFLRRTQPDLERDRKGIQCCYDLEDDEGWPDGVGDAKKDERIKSLEEKVAELERALQAASSTPEAPSSTDSTAVPLSSVTFTQPFPAFTDVHAPFSGPFDLAGPSHLSGSGGGFPLDTSHPSPRTWNGSSEPEQILNGMVDQFLPPGFMPPALPPQTGMGGGVSVTLDTGLVGGQYQEANGRHLGQDQGEQVQAGAGAGNMPGMMDGGMFVGEAGSMGGAMLNVLWPGWPSTLPLPSVVEHLVDTFFTHVPSIARIIHRQTFLRRLALPPTHPDFPQRSLLHAICAVASRWSASVHVRSIPDVVAKADEDARRLNGRGVMDDPKEEACFSERNGRYAVMYMRYQCLSGRGLMDILQAMLVMCHWDQCNSAWLDAWILIGSATRLAICLGLMSEDHQRGPPALRRSILGPPRDGAEREERRATVYTVMCYDSVSSMSSGWPGCMPLEELTVPMPSSRLSFETRELISPNVQTAQSSDLYERHPVEDGFVMLIKSKILLSRVARFTRLCRGMCPEQKMAGRGFPEFRVLDRDLLTFNMSFPPSLREPVQYMRGYAKGIDSDLVSAHLVHRIAAIHLHEPFADPNNPKCVSAARLLTEARGCLAVVYSLSGVSADVSYSISPISSWFFFSAARALLLFYQRALEHRNMEAARSFHSEISKFKNVLSSLATRNALASRHWVTLEMMTRRIEGEALGHPIINGDFSGLSQNQQDHAAGDIVAAIEGIEPTHPDSMLVVDHLRGEKGGDLRDLSVQELLDEKRGFVRLRVNDRGVSGAGGGMWRGGQVGVEGHVGRL
ncbi:hypothetical protein IAT38_008100 [Cryptococcus sp. DSM 104549]